MHLLCNSFIVRFRNPNSKYDFIRNSNYHSQVRIVELSFENAIQNFKQRNNVALSVEQDKLLSELSNYVVIEIVQEEGKAVLNNLLEEGLIDLIEPNYVISLDSRIEFEKENLLSKQWYLDAIRVRSAWDKAKGKGILIGIIDTGVDWVHKELKGRIWINPKEDINLNGSFEPWPDTISINGIKGDLNGIDDDGNGFVDDVIGYDFVNQTVGNIGDYFEPDPIPADENGHGTMVAGVIASSINDTGIAGVAPESKIVVLRAFDLSGNAEIKDIAGAIVYAALNKVKILNFSFGSHFDSKLLHDAIRFAYSMGCIMVASAGNDGEIVDHFPSDYPEVISVGATTRENKIGRSSNFGQRIDIYAPGYDIFTLDLNNSYKFVNGTSFSAPIVSGVIALLMELNQNLSAEDVKSILKATGKSLNQDKKSFGQNLVNANDAVGFVGTSRCEILYPTNFQEINKDEIKSLKVLYSVFSPLFQNYSIELYKNDTVFVKNIVFRKEYQSILDSAGIELSSLEEGSYTLKLIATLRNENKLTYATKLFVFSNASKLVIKYIKIISSLFENRNLPVLITESELPNYCKVSIYEDSFLVNTYLDQFYSTNHSIALHWDNFEKKSYKIVVELISKTGLKYYDTLEFTNQIPIIQMPIKKRFNSLPMSYLFTSAVSLKQVKFKGILINPYKNLQWSGLRYYQFKDSIFVETARYQQPFIPVSIGNSNQNNFDEILTTSYGKTIIFEPTIDSTFFDRVIFQSSTDQILWASEFFDLNGDGKDEVVCFNDEGFQVFSYGKEGYKLVSLLSIPDTLGKIGTKPNLRIADLDGDANLEFVFISTSGYLLIYEFNPINFTFNFEYKLKFEGEEGSFLTCLGKPSNSNNLPGLFILSAQNLLGANFDVENSTIWKISYLFSDRSNSYKLQEVMNFWGARVGATSQGIFYRNGINAEDVDRENGDELLLSLFPNFYILKYDKSINKWTPILWLPFVYSNGVVSDDFDNDGVKEFGVCFWDSLKFYQLLNNNLLTTPVNLDGWIDVDDMVFLHWEPVLNANKYQIYKLKESQNSLEFFSETGNNFISFKKDIISGKTWFYVRAIDTSLNFSPSQFSEGILIFDTLRLTPIKVFASSGEQLYITFSGKLPSRVPLKAFTLFDTTGNMFEINNIIIVNDTFTIAFIDKLLPDGKYYLYVDKFRDFYGNYSFPSQLEFTIESHQKYDSLLLFRRFTFVSNASFEIEFDSELDTSSVINIDNYTVIPFGKIEKVELIEPNKIFIEISKNPNIFSLGRDFYIVLGKVYSRDKRRFVQPPYNSICITQEASEIENAFVYPNPIKLSDGKVLTIANISSNTKVEIFDYQFQKIGEFFYDGWQGGIQLDLTQINYNFYSGIYYFRLSKEKGGNWITSSLKKFAIIK